MLVVDTLGELLQFYACADVAFVGGSLADIGGHNLLEPAAVGTAIVTGPHLHNFAEIARRLEDAGALCIGADPDAVAAALEQLLADATARERMADRRACTGGAGPRRAGADVGTDRAGVAAGAGSEHRRGSRRARVTAPAWPRH